MFTTLLITLLGTAVGFIFGIAAALGEIESMLEKMGLEVDILTTEENEETIKDTKEDK